MRFCPFCSAENNDDMAVCQSCGRRLPPLPPRRARNAPPTGVQLPPRSTAPGSPPPVPRRTGNTNPPPMGAQAATRAEPTVAQAPNQALLDAITPGPAAQRREPAPPDLHPNNARRATDGSQPIRSNAIPSVRTKSPSAAGPPPTPPPIDRVKSLTPPPVRSDALPPPGPHDVSLTTSPPLPSAPAYPVIPKEAFSDDFHTTPAADPIHVAARSANRREHEPPPTRLHRADSSSDRPFTPPKVNPVPEIPEPGLINAARYATRFGQARWQRRGAIKTLGAEIKQDTDALDQVLGALGKEARTSRVEGRVFSAENAAINAAEERISALSKEHGDVDARKVDENSKFVDVERERNAKLVEAERLVEEAQRELATLDGQRRSLRETRKSHESRQKTYLKKAEDLDRQAGSVQMGEQRGELRRSAEGFRKEAAALEPERQEMDRKLAALERPINEATAKLDAAKAELDAAKRSLSDAREGHTHRLAELDAEQKRKSREMALAEAEIQRRLVTLGTLVNLNRIEDPAFGELYQRIDRIRGAITARTTEIEKLTAEREAYDRGVLIRGIATIGGAIVLFIALLVILKAAL